MPNLGEWPSYPAADTWIMCALVVLTGAIFTAFA